MILLTPWDLALAALLVLLLALTSMPLKLAIARPLIIASVRATIQLLLIGLVLKTLFETVHLGFVALIAIVMVTIAGAEVTARLHYRFKGLWGFGMGTTAMFISSFVVALLGLLIIIQADPWYAPRYAIPLLGMILGNSLNGIALALDRLTHAAWHQRREIEARLLHGEGWSEAMTDIRRDCMRSGMMPMINAMAAAGVVSLPGMMTGQILAGSPPLEAVKYQIMIFFLITAASGFGTVAAIWLGSRRLFDDRQRLRLERITVPSRG